MLSNCPQILDRLTADFHGVIWLGQNPLEIYTPGFLELNYIFDGIISRTLKEYSEEQKLKQLSFFTKSYGQNFFLYYFIEKVSFPIFIPKNDIENRNKILFVQVVPETSSQIEILKKEFPNFQFELLELSKIIN